MHDVGNIWISGVYTGITRGYVFQLSQTIHNAKKSIHNLPTEK